MIQKNFPGDVLVNIFDIIKLTYEGTTSDWWDNLSTGEKGNILEGIKDYKQGSILDPKEFWRALRMG